MDENDNHTFIKNYTWWHLSDSIDTIMNISCIDFSPSLWIMYHTLWLGVMSSVIISYPLWCCLSTLPFPCTYIFSIVVVSSVFSIEKGCHWFHLCFSPDVLHSHLSRVEFLCIFSWLPNIPIRMEWRCLEYSCRSNLYLCCRQEHVQGVVERLQ